MKFAIDTVLGSKLFKGVLRFLVGRRYVGWLLPLVGYRATHMVDTGESVLLGGIYNSQTARGFALAVGPRGRVLVAEANPENAERLRAELDDCANCTVINVAIWREVDRLEFLFSEVGDQGYNRVAADEIQPFPFHLEPTPAKIVVPAAPIDELVAEHLGGEVDHVNLTINGAEAAALDGLSATLRKNPLLRMYINSEHPEPYERVVGKLDEMGFQIATVELRNILNKRIRIRRIYAWRRT